AGTLASNARLRAGFRNVPNSPERPIAVPPTPDVGTDEPSPGTTEPWVDSMPLTPAYRRLSCASAEWTQVTMPDSRMNPRISIRAPSQFCTKSILPISLRAEPASPFDQRKRLPPVQLM